MNNIVFIICKELILIFFLNFSFFYFIIQNTLIDSFTIIILIFWKFILLWRLILEIYEGFIWTKRILRL